MGTPRSGGSVFQLSRKESWEIKDHMVLRNIETPERFFAENLNDSGMFPWISLFYYPLFFAENLATKPLFTSNPMLVISIASGVIRAASRNELQRKDLYAEHLRRNSKNMLRKILSRKLTFI